MNYDILHQLDFSDNEIKIYITLLKKGKLSPAALAKITKINRATVYTTTQKLISKGIVSEDIANRGVHFIANPPEQLYELLKKDKEQLQQKEQYIQQAVADFSRITHEAGYPVPRIRFIEEERLEKFLYTQSKVWDQSALSIDKIWWGYQDHVFVEQYTKWIEWLWKSVHKLSVVKLLSNISAAEKEFSRYYRKREVHYMKEANFTATTWVVGDFLILVNTRVKPYYLVEIHDRMLAHNMREVFQQLWKRT